MADSKSDSDIKLGIPKGRMHQKLLQLLSEAGIHVSISDRGYRPTINLDGYQVKLLKPQNILQMLHMGSRDIGFGGIDWVQNLNVDVVELLDTGLDPVRIVAAAPDPNMVADALKTGRKLRIASEYETLTKQWIADKGLNAVFVRAFGATESFPPEDADMIVDNTATGSTLKANGLHIIDVVTTSSTRLFAHAGALQDPAKKQRIDELVLLLKSVLSGRQHKMVEFNMTSEVYDQHGSNLPAMRAPTVAKLFSGQGYAIKILVKTSALPSLLPSLKAMGATEIVVTDVQQVIS